VSVRRFYPGGCCWPRSATEDNRRHSRSKKRGKLPLLHSGDYWSQRSEVHQVGWPRGDEDTPFVGPLGAVVVLRKDSQGELLVLSIYIYIRKKRGRMVHIVFMGVLPLSLTAIASTVSFSCVCILLANPPSKALLYLLSALAHGCQHTVTGYCCVIAAKDSLLPPHHTGCNAENGKYIILSKFHDKNCRRFNQMCGVSYADRFIHIHMRGRQLLLPLK
jgi:hypothetical protein